MIFKKSFIALALGSSCLGPSIGLSQTTVGPMMTLSCPTGTSFVGSITTGVFACAADLPAGFYVSTTGSDSNAGTLTAPFATLVKARDAMRASGTVKTTYIRAGTYTPASAGTGCGDTLGIALILDASDSGQTWSYYPPDGYGSAVINGQASGSTGLGWGVCANADDVKVDGLSFKNFQITGIQVGGKRPIVTNNIVDNMTHTTRTTISIALNDALDGKINHNYVKNSTVHGIGSWPITVGGSNNLRIENNYITDVCTVWADCGGIYVENNIGGAQSGQKVNYNYITNVRGAGGGEPIYIDDGSSAVEVRGNVMAGSNWQGYFVHGGSNNLATGNIVDLGANNSMGPVSAQWVAGSTMAGNTWKNNIILAAAAGSNAGTGYNCNTGPCQMTLGQNSYYNYVGTGINRAGSLGTDSPYTYQNPNFTCGWTYTLPSNSPVYSSPVNFPVQPAGWGAAGFWGPPGFLIPRTGIVPSPPHAC